MILKNGFSSWRFRCIHFVLAFRLIPMEMKLQTSIRPVNAVFLPWLLVAPVGASAFVGDLTTEAPILQGNVIQQTGDDGHERPRGEKRDLESSHSELGPSVLDCSAMINFSGGTIFSIKNDELRVYAIIFKGGFDEKDGHRFSVSDHSYTIAIRTNEQILKDAISLSQGASCKPAEGVK